MKKRLQTLSKFFYDDEILAKEADGTIHLKEGVKRVFAWPQLKDMGLTFDTEETSEYINEFRRMQDKIDFVNKIEEEERNFND